MKLLTAAIIKQLEKNPLYSTEKETVKPIIVKFFAPWNNWTWYAVEANKLADGDWEFFGLVDGLEKELGYFYLNELASIRGVAGLTIERDRYFDGMVLDTSTTPATVRKA